MSAETELKQLKDGTFISALSVGKSEEGLEIETSCVIYPNGLIEMDPTSVRGNYKILNETIVTDSGDEHHVCPVCHDYLMEEIEDDGENVLVCMNPNCE